MKLGIISTIGLCTLLGANSSFASSKTSECGIKLQLNCQTRFESGDHTLSSILKNNTLLVGDFCGGRVSRAFVMTIADAKSDLYAGAAVLNLNNNGVYNMTLVHRLASSPGSADRSSANGEIAIGQKLRISTDVQRDQIVVAGQDDTGKQATFTAQSLTTECEIVAN